MANHPLVLTAYCSNRPGIVASMSKAIFEMGCDIVDLQQFDDSETGQFFSRVVFTGVSSTVTERAARRALGPVLEQFGMVW